MIGKVALPIAGLMSNEPADQWSRNRPPACWKASALCGCDLNNPNMQLSLLALVVIPELRISDLGLVDVTRFNFIPVLEKELRLHADCFTTISVLHGTNMSQPSVAQRLHDQLLHMITETQPGERLPSEPYLAEQLSVSRATLREAMRAFETQGIIRRKQGSGTYVNQPPRVLESGLEVLESIETMAQRSGLSVDIGELTLEKRTARLR